MILAGCISKPAFTGNPFWIVSAGPANQANICGVDMQSTR